MSKLITEFPSLIGLTNSHLIAVGDPITGTLYKMTVGDLTMGPQGMLIPRMTTTERNNIATPTTGLLVYDTTLNDIYIYNGTGWQLMPNEASSPTWSGLHYFQKNGIGTTPTEAVRLENTTSATSGTAQYSPYLNFSGKWYNTTSLTSNTFGVRMYAHSVNGSTTNPGGYLNFQTSPDGITWTDRMGIYQNGFVRFNSQVETNNINPYSGNLITLGGSIYSTNASQTNGFVSGVYVGGNPGNIASSAIFHVNSTTKGVLIPRMTTTERNNIATPATGLLVYDTTLNGIYIYNGTGWQLMPNEASSPTWTGTHTFTGKLEVTSTTQGFLPPRMTTTQRDAIVSPAEGLVIYNTTDKKHQGYDGTSWNNFY